MRRGVRRPLVALVALLVALAIGYSIQASDSGNGSRPSPTASMSTRSVDQRALSSLPPQARQTVALIMRGGPFPYPRSDGGVYRNDEHRLPPEPAGYYREYTVPTPGSADRGQRRIITGSAGEFFYTPDHYAHFVRVAVLR